MAQNSQSDTGSANSSRKQWIAGGLGIAFGYAALLTTGLGGLDTYIETTVSQLTVTDGGLHVLFALCSGTVGATAMAIWDKIQSKDEPTPPKP